MNFRRWLSRRQAALVRRCWASNRQLAPQGLPCFRLREMIARNEMLSMCPCAAPRRLVASSLAFVGLLGFVFVAAFAPGNAWSRNEHRSASDTQIYDAHGKWAGEIPGGDLDGTVQGPNGLEAYWGLTKTGLLHFEEDYCAHHCGYGYARERPGDVWYVRETLSGDPIGTVRRRTPRIWDAYLGLGSRAHRVGWARGARPGVGAAALLVVPGVEP
jgi:hypothetical protein